MNKLAKKQCVPCKGGVPPLKGEELKKIYNKLKNKWSIVDGHHLEKEYKFNDFKEALGFTNRVGNCHSCPDVIINLIVVLKTKDL